MRSTFGLSRTPNLLLADLPPSDLDLLRPHLTRVRLVARQRLVERGQAAEHIFFLEEGIASLNAETQPGEPDVQVAMIGREGMAGGLALLDAATVAFGSVVIQIPGPALRIRVAELVRCIEESPAVREVCLGYIQSLARQIMATAAFNARGSLAERCVRWLLMAHERIDGDDIPVTHEALAAMLGVRRSGVTVATTALQKANMIHTSRGRISVVDRVALQALAQGGIVHDGDTDPGTEAASDAIVIRSDVAGPIGVPYDTEPDGFASSTSFRPAETFLR